MSYVDHVLQHKRLLVTGATGFIGGRLAHRLASEEGAEVTGVGRNLANASPLAQAGVNLLQADLLDETAMSRLIEGQEIVFHLGWVGREEGAVGGAHALNVKITGDLIHMAAEAGVQRFLFVSSINAYGPPMQSPIDETYPVDTRQRDAYGRAKAVSEQNAMEIAGESGLELVIIRPGMVYGPRSPYWTVGMLKLVQKGVPVIFGDGSGFAYPTFIDNLIDGLLLAAVRPQAAGEAFNVCDPPVSWRSFFSYYSAMSGRKLRSLPIWAAGILAFASETFNLRLPLTRDRLKFYVNKNIFPVAKAKALLGYQPRISIEEGMEQTKIWLRESGYLDK